MKPEWVKRIIFGWTLLGAAIVLHQLLIWRGGVPSICATALKKSSPFMFGIL